MEKVGRRRRRTYTEDYKAEVVQFCLSGEKSIATVARELGFRQRWWAGGWRSGRRTPASGKD